MSSVEIFYILQSVDSSNSILAANKDNILATQIDISALANIVCQC